MQPPQLSHLAAQASFPAFLLGVVRGIPQLELYQLIRGIPQLELYQFKACAVVKLTRMLPNAFPGWAPVFPSVKASQLAELRGPVSKRLHGGSLPWPLL